MSVERERQAGDHITAIPEIVKGVHAEHQVEIVFRERKGLANVEVQRRRQPLDAMLLDLDLTFGGADPEVG
jgi:tRNA C32,U32 (ribose-2'-O)-methylase TrmJ